MANTKKYVSLDKLGLYDEKIKKVISDSDAAALQSAKDYADGLAVNYDAAGSAASALDSAKAYADGKDTAIAAAQKAGDDAATAAGVADGKAVAAQGAADKAQGDVDNLKNYVGTFTASEGVDTVVKYIDAKTANIASDETVGAIDRRLTQAEKDIDAIEADYLKGSDKTDLEGQISGVQDSVNTLSGTHATDKKALEDAIALKADQTALDGVSAIANAAATQTALQGEIDRATGEEARIEGLITAETNRATGVESGLNTRLLEVEAFFNLAEGEKLDTALDTLVEIQKYITDEGAAADQMVLDIAANKKAIEDHVATNHDFASADTALKNELTGEINKKADKTTVEGIDGRLTTAEGKITTAEGKITTLEGAVATKAEKSYVDDELTKLVNADTGLGNRIKALEDKHGDGEGTVESLIATAKQEAIDAAAQDATTKAGNAETNAKGYADGLNTAMNARVEALEEIDHTHTNKAELDLIISGDKAKWDEAYTKRHEHGNKTVIDGITAENITTWNTVTSKAAQSDLTAVSDRVTTLETWHTNFVECSQEDINALFA
jgi:predicted  nucleic acid-binding Zn-ribbon protein